MYLIDCRHDWQLIESILSPNSVIHGHQIIAISPDHHAYKIKLYAMGIFDYISYPLIHEEIQRRINIYFELLKHSQELKPHLFSSWLPPTIQPSSGFDSIDQDIVIKTCEHLLEHISQNHSLESVARTIGTNRNRLTRAFKTVLNQGMAHWLREQRMIRASILLCSGHHSVQQIAFDVGYREMANFSTAFKRQFGLSPQNYRAKMTKSQIFVTNSKAH